MHCLTALRTERTAPTAPPPPPDGPGHGLLSLVAGFGVTIGVTFVRTTF